MRHLFLVTLACLWASVAHAQLPIIPGAPNSPGMATRAAYACGGNPAILRVTSLNDSGAGTLRAALEASGPRVIIFDTSGYINLAANIYVLNPCVTVAGQTAPSPGITLRMAAGGVSDGMLFINTHDVFLQHLRIRPGASTCNSGLLVYGTYTGPMGAFVRQHYNIVLDHISTSWAQDENISYYPTDVNGGDSNITVWRSIMSEGLLQAPGSSGCSGGGLANGHGILQVGGHKTAVIQSLFSKNWERNPQIAGDSQTFLGNNIIYQWQGEWGFFIFNFSQAPGPWYLTSIGNRFIVGPNSNNAGVGGAVQYWYGEANPPSSEVAGDQHYHADDTVSNSFGTTIFPTNQGHGFAQLSYNPAVGSIPSQAPLPAGYTPIASSALEAYLLPKVGARPTDRDAVDTRVLSEVTTRTGNFIQQESDVGGYPALAVNSRVLATPANPHTVTTSGYTNLEVWLQGYATTIEGETPPPAGPPDVTPAAGAVVVTAHMTGTAGAALTSITNAIGGGWTLQPVATASLVLSAAGRAMNTVTGAGQLILANGAPITANYDVAGAFRVITLPAGSSYSLWARVIPGGPAVTGYFAALDVDSSTFSLRMATADSYQVLESCAPQTFTLNTTYNVIIRVRSSPPSKHLVVNGVQCASSYDNSITAAGLAGLSVYAPATPDSETEGVHFDEVTVTDVQGVTPVQRLRMFRAVSPGG